MNGPRHYTYVSIDPIESDQQGRNPSYWVTHVSYGKESEYSKDSPSPYLLPNEWICGHIANFLRLPSPPFAVMKNSNGPALFTNLQFTPEHLPPPDATAANCWRVDKHTCTGIFLFDLLVLNHDRKPRNLYVDNPRQPREILVYDHDDALSGAMFDGATEYMSKNLDEFLEYHMLMKVIDTDQHFTDWNKRIQSIPDWFLRELCNEASEFPGFSKRNAKTCREFLTHRRDNLVATLSKHRNKLEAVKSWLTLPLM